MAKKQKLPVYISPKGVASYPYLLKYDDKFVKEGEYSVKLILDADENKEFLDDLKSKAEAVYKKTIAELKEAKKVKAAKALTMHVPFSEEEDDEGEPTGRVVLNFKLKHQVTTGEGKTFTQQPDVFDAKKKPLADDTRIGSGSIIRVAFNIIEFYAAANKNAGLSLRLKAAQIIDLVEYGGNNAESYGFGEEDGFEADDADDANDFDDDDEDEEDNGSGDF